MRLTVRKLVTQFLRWAESALAPATVEAYRHQLKKFLRARRRTPVASLRPMHLTGWAKTWHESQAVIRLFNWAVREAHLLKKNPFADCKKPRRSYRKRILTPTEVQNYLRNARPAPRRFLMAMRETAARPQEIRLARWSDLVSEDLVTPIADALDQGKALLVMHEFKDKAKRKDTSRPRVLLLSRRLGRMIGRILKCRGTKDGPIFLNTKGKPWTRNAVRCMMRRLRRRLGYTADANGERIVCYTLRHSLATLAASRGMTDRTIADWLGHVETRTVSRYLHLQVRHIREALARHASDRSSGRKDAKPTL